MSGATMVLHKGGKECNRGELDLIPLPQKTETYQPVSHFELANKLLTVSQDIMSGFTLTKEKYGIARDGNQLFGMLQFRNSEPDMGLAIGFRNSYDKSMSVGFACGASVFVCDNLALTGDIVVMRKHTKSVWEELEELAVSSCYRAMKNFKQVVLDSFKLKNHGLDIDAGFSHLGRLYGHDLIGPRQMTVAKDEWLKPSHEAFAPRTGWSLYNAVTESLKSCPPTDIMEKHVNLHNYFKALVAPAIEINIAGQQYVGGVQ
jgi:hypothetical protein